MRAAPALLVLAILLATGCRSTPPATAGAAEATQGPSVPALEDAGIEELSRLMAAGTLDSVTLTRAYLARIESIDRGGPMLRSVIATNPQALADAAALDAERRAGHVRGPLHGIPLLLKDNIDAMPMATTAGSLALAEHRPARDAFLVERLRAQGAVILGKTNLSEWANFRSTRSISGWSGLGGQTRNAHVLDRNPCGSSSGSAVAAAAALATAAVGTETDGSIICPTAVNGVVGIKPTLGRVSRHGVVPIASAQDTAGPMARSVADAVLLLDALSAPDARDPATIVKSATFAPLAPHLRVDGLRGARIGVLRRATGYHPAVDAAFERSLDALRQAGATLVDAEIPTAGQWGDAEFAVLLAQFRPELERYLAESGAPVRTLQALIDFNRANADREMPHFGQELFEQALKAPAPETREVRDAMAKARRLAGPEGIDAALRRYRLDALVAPSTGPAWRTDTILGDHFTGAGYGAAAVAGYPSITVPMGDVRGLPLGLVFMGTRWSEPRLVEFAYGFEQATRARRAPRFLPSLDGPATLP
ncbi:MAG: amidase [Pseudomonadota bacterium]